MVKYLCYFMHRLLDFRHTEIQSLTSLTESEELNSDPVAFEAPFGGSYLSPFWYAWLPSEACAKHVAGRSMLLKGFLEIWGEGSNWEELLQSVKSFSRAKIDCWNSPAASFKIVVDSWGKVIKQEEQLAIINKFDFLGLQGQIKMNSPELTLRLIVADSAENNGLPTEVPYRIYFGRQIASSDRTIIHKYGLPRRKYLGPTSMDTEMAFIMCNQAKVTKGHLVYDPFVGTGSILVAASHFGAQTIGADIDIRVVRDGKVDKTGNRVDIWENFRDYALMPPNCLFRADAHRLPFRPGLQEIFDAIVCDPPYGVRAGGKKSVAKTHPVTHSETHIPSTDPYTWQECLKDLLHLAAKFLKLDGRLVFFMPSAPGLDQAQETAAHPMLTLVANSEQPLTTRYSRRLITMQKICPYDAEQAALALAAPCDERIDGSIHEMVYAQRDKAKGDPVFAPLQRYRGKLV